MSAEGDQAKGRIKEAMGVLTDDEKLANDLAGKAEDVVDDVRKAVTKD